MSDTQFSFLQIFFLGVTNFAKRKIRQAFCSRFFANAKRAPRQSLTQLADLPSILKA